MKAALFPGQGSQVVGMGLKLCEQSERAKEIFERANQALGFDLKKLCFEGPIEELTKTEVAQPALLTTAYACYAEFADKGGKVQAAAGHSLGEYTALVAAGALKFEDAVVLVNKRGKYMQESVPQGMGGMLAVMGLEEAQLKEIISKVSSGVVEIANLNCPGQTVLAGNKEGLAHFQDIAVGAKIIPLNVSAPFHCSLMKPAADKLALDLDSVEFKDLLFPIVANVTAKKITSGNEARELLKRQVCESVRWTDSVNYLANEMGVKEVIEFGPGGVLVKLCKRINASLNRLQVEDTESAAKVIG